MPLQALVRTYAPKVFGALVMLVSGPVLAVLTVVVGLCYFLLTIGAFMVLVIGPWDFVVWVLKADVRTTHGDAPVLGIVMCIAAGVVVAGARAIREPLREAWRWAEVLVDGEPEWRRVRATYSDPET